MNNLTRAIANSREVYGQALEGCEENIKKWKEHEKEYTELKERLEQFPRKISHDVMVPLGKVALMPGQLIHTNEVLVLLGDGWFVTRSAYQANEIVDRRLKYVTEMIAKYEEERRLYVDRLEATTRLLTENDGGDYFEIREPVTDETEKPKKVRIARQPGSVNKTKATNPPVASDAENPSKKVSDQEFSDLMDRLDELHFQERFDNQQSKLLSSTSRGSGDVKPLSTGTVVSASGSGRKVAWKNNDESGSAEAVTSDHATSLPGTSASSDVNTRPTKSILKNRDEHSLVGELPPSPYEQRPKVISSVTEEAFCGKVIERTPLEPSLVSQTTKKPVRRVSRFAQERAGLKKQ